MRRYKKFAGDERTREGPYAVECPRCGAKPGQNCRKPSGQINESHKARNERARLEIERGGEAFR